MRPLLFFCVFALLAAGLAPTAADADVLGHDSDRNKVRSRISKGGHVLWGVTLNEAEYAKFTAASVASVATANPGPVLGYFREYGMRTIDKVREHAPEVGYAIVKDLVMRALKDRGRTLRHGRLHVTGGIGTYKRWKRVVYHEPRTKKVKKWINKRMGWWTWVTKTEMKKVERRVALPNHHQPYIKVAIKGPRVTNGSAGPTAPSVQSYGTVTLRNRTRIPLRFSFRWSSRQRWQSYTLRPGQHRLFWTKGSDRSPEVQSDWAIGPATHIATLRIGQRPLRLARPPRAHEAVPYDFQIHGSQLRLVIQRR